MAYQTGTATDITDLMSKLTTFAQANGFTQDYYNGTNRHLSLSRSVDNLYVSFCWATSGYIGIFQALNYEAAHDEEPWDQDNDSGNGNSDFDSFPDRGRQVSEIGNGPFTAYHFFAYTDPYNILVVLEFSAGLFRHFGFGKIDKVATWTGGAWAAGHLWNPGISYAMYAVPTFNGHTILLDGWLSHNLTTYKTYSDNAGATLHCEGLPGQDASSKWGVCVNYNTDDAYLYNDRGSNPRVRISGGFRMGPSVAQFLAYLPDLANGYVPIAPIDLFYARADGGADGFYYLGRLPNVGHIHLHGIDPAQEITVGADTWIAFPMVRKSNIGGINQESENAGIIYKKVT